jgi:hypothetical protein
MNGGDKSMTAKTDAKLSLMGGPVQYGGGMKGIPAHSKAGEDTDPN